MSPLSFGKFVSKNMISGDKFAPSDFNCLVGGPNNDFRLGFIL